MIETKGVRVVAALFFHLRIPNVRYCRGNMRKRNLKRISTISISPRMQIINDVHERICPGVMLLFSQFLIEIEIFQ